MKWRDDAIKHAMKALPREACGLLVVADAEQVYWPCRNMATGNDAFILHPEDYAEADMSGEVIAIVHSHPYSTPLPSSADKLACDASGLAWHIVSVPDVKWEHIEPTARIIEA